MRLCLIGLIMFVCCGPVYTQSSYTSIPCAFDSLSFDIECGFLAVPQSRSSALGSIQLAVVIVHSTSDAPAPDPLVYLAGGPGGSSTPYTLALMDTWLKPFLRERDVILVDQRGTGYSVPNLSCKEYSRLILKYLSVVVPASQMIQERAEALQTCQSRLVADGIVTSSYTSAESAADLEDLRLALNLDSWNLLGVSYGTRLALTVLRDYPEGVRSVILDSVYPPQVSLFRDVYDNGARARQAVFDACLNDALCVAAYPDLEQRFWQLIADLNAHPQMTTITLQQEDRDFVWTGDRLYGDVFLWLYETSSIARIPYYIDLLWQKKYDDLDLLTAALQAEFSGLGLSTGLYMSIQCGEERPLSMLEDRLTLLDSYPRLTNVLNADLWLSEAGDAACRVWQPDPPPALENAPITSDVPVLLLSGEYDPITPPTWAELAAQTLSASQMLLVPEVGHGALRSNVCVGRIAVAYLAAPTEPVHSECLKSAPPLMFYVPTEIDQSPSL